MANDIHNVYEQEITTRVAPSNRPVIPVPSSAITPEKWLETHNKFHNAGIFNQLCPHCKIDTQQTRFRAKRASADTSATGEPDQENEVGTNPAAVKVGLSLGMVGTVSKYICLWVPSEWRSYLRALATTWCKDFKRAPHTTEALKKPPVFADEAAAFLESQLLSHGLEKIRDGEWIFPKHLKGGGSH